ncbi:MAG TPA: hypothetical protein VFI50_04300 [Casimicrobiaceae bacterium]|jgi:hypothetical protein|nr:hypothetical protein [Casimicrobiaceae bacterium]
MLAARVIRSVPAAHASAWYAEAMRLWKRGPVVFTLLALIVLAVNLLLNLLPVAGVALAQVVLPLLECGLLYACLAADRGDRPRLSHLFAFVGAPWRAQAAVVAAGLMIFGVQALVAQGFGGINLLTPANAADPISGGALVVTYAAGIAVSLPLTYVPFAALFDGAGFRRAFAQSAEAFTRNLRPLVVYGALSLALLLLGLATSGLGLLLALPWSAAASYASWKDVFDVS